MGIWQSPAGGKKTQTGFTRPGKKPKSLNPLEWPYPFVENEAPRPGKPETAEPGGGYTGRLDGETLDKEDVDEFLSGEMSIMADSTNVYSFRYRPRTRELEVVFLDESGTGPGHRYLYAEISKDEAKRMAGAYSKGKFVRNFLIAEGKPYMRIS